MAKADWSNFALRLLPTEKATYEAIAAANFRSLNDQLREWAARGASQDEQAAMLRSLQSKTALSADSANGTQPEQSPQALVSSVVEA